MKAIGLRFIDDLIGAGWSVKAACELLGVHRTSWYRLQNPATRTGVQVPQKERAYPSRITTDEADAFMAVLNSSDYEDLSVTQAYWRMLDAGQVPFSVSTAHRVVAAHGQNGDRRVQRRGGQPKRPKPVHMACAPNQLWSWDITMLRGPGKIIYRLYAIVDVFSRKIVGHRVETSETPNYAQAMIDDAVATNQQHPAVLHADNGGPMRAATTIQFAQSLGIKLSFSRPRVSNDNPYSESTFKTIKYHLDFPARFESIDHARDYMAAFIADYNANHRHSGLRYYTPDDVHYGRAELVRARRQAALEARHCAHPERFRNDPIAAGPPTRAGINSPENTELSQTA